MNDKEARTLRQENEALHDIVDYLVEEIAELEASMPAQASTYPPVTTTGMDYQTIITVKP